MAKSNIQRPEITPEQMAMFQAAVKNAEDIICTCGNPTFIEVTRLKRLSKLLTGDTQDRIIPIPVVICYKCHKEYNPEEEKPKDEIVLDFKR